MLGMHDPIQKVMNFLKPEDFYHSAMYLLFSSERSLEKEYETKLKEAFKVSDLSPERLRILNRVIVLECTGYGLAMFKPNYDDFQNPQFKQVFAPATYVIPAGEAPSKMSPSSLEKKVYNFKKPL